MQSSRVHLCLMTSGLLLIAACAPGQTTIAVDSDGDGLSDALEDSLLQTFRPTLMVSAEDCSALPARFAPGIAMPTALHDDGTLYGQAFPRQRAPGEPQQIELHFYHLWRRDCGRMGHLLDAEHVAVLLEAAAGPPQDRADAWTATYWYAAAHEDTVCDASQLARATTLLATTQGARVWVSSGKHASFLNEELCRHGCGGDVCVQSRTLPAQSVINLGEAAHPMNGAAWISSSQWPLDDKLTRSDFTPDRLTRLNRLPATDIAWATPAKRPAQAAILGGNATVDGTLRSGQATGSALAASGRSTDTALSVAGGRTSSALNTASHTTARALGKTLHSVQHVIAH